MDRRVGVRADEIAFLRRVPMLSQVPVPSIEHLASRLRRLTVCAGREVFEQGDAGDGSYVITAGRAEVVAGHPEEGGAVLREDGGPDPHPVVDRHERAAG